MREPDRIVQEEYGRIPFHARFPRACNAVYGNGVAFINVGYKAVVREAVRIRRNGWAENRAQAVEMAFDHLLSAGTKAGKRWRRTGEVHLNRREGSAVALCYSYTNE